MEGATMPAWYLLWVAPLGLLLGYLWHRFDKSLREEDDD